ESDAVRDGIQPAPAVPQSFEYAAEMLVVLHVARERRKGTRSADRLQQFVQIFFQAIVLVRERQLGALAVEGAGDSPGDAALVGHSHDQRPLALKEHGIPPAQTCARTE